MFLLRRIYPDDRNILCDFEETRAIFAGAPPPSPEHGPYWFPDAARFGEGATYSILAALLARVNRAWRRHLDLDERRASASDPLEQLQLDQLDLWWRQYLSMHYDLMFVVQDTLDERGQLALLSDDELLYDEDDQIEQSAYYRNLPCEERIFWAGQLPDVVAAVSSMGWFWCVTFSSFFSSCSTCLLAPLAPRGCVFGIASPWTIAPFGSRACTSTARLWIHASAEVWTRRIWPLGWTKTPRPWR